MAAKRKKKPGPKPSATGYERVNVSLPKGLWARIMDAERLRAENEKRKLNASAWLAKLAEAELEREGKP